MQKFVKYLAVSGMVVSLFLLNSLAFMLLLGAFVSTYFGVPKLSMAESVGLLFYLSSCVRRGINDYRTNEHRKIF
jgi:hypothetical protein